MKKFAFLAVLLAPIIANAASTESLCVSAAAFANGLAADRDNGYPLWKQIQDNHNDPRVHTDRALHDVDAVVLIVYSHPKQSGNEIADRLYKKCIKSNGEIN